VQLGYFSEEMRAFWARSLALLAALLLTLPLALMGQSQYLCHMMERVSFQRCCCSHSSDVVEAPSKAPEIKAQGCCERVQGNYQKATASLSDGNSRVFVQALAYVEAFELSLEAPVAHLTPIEPRQARAPPPPALKLFLKHCSFLT